MLQSFPEDINYYRSFFRNFPKHAKPLNCMLRKEEPDTFSKLTEKQLAGFEYLMAALVNPPNLAFPRLILPTMLDTDPSANHLGFYPVQQENPEDPKSCEPIGLFSKRPHTGQK